MQHPARLPVIGIVPAAGRATRLPARTCSKELILVGDRAVGQYLVDAMVDAGADRICIVIAPDKQDICTHFGQESPGGVPIRYVCQEQPTGMSDAIDLAYPHLAGATVLMGMPDTIVDPPDSLAQLHHELQRSGADIALAISPTAEPERLGPVDFDRTGRVREIFDKPERPLHNMVWTVACWNARFTDYLHDHLATRARVRPEAPLGLIFQSALQDGFQIQALPFPNGRYIDAGTIEGLQAARHFIAGAAAPR